MLGMGATLAVRDFGKVLQRPGPLLLGLCIQLIFMPALAMLWIHLFGFSEGWAVGLILVSVVPGGAFSNLLTFLARGHVPLSIAMTTASTAGCIATVPLILGLLAETHLPADFSFPTTKVVFDIFGFLLIPLAIGMAIFRTLPKHAAKVSKWSINLSVTLIILITVGALGAGRIKVGEYGIVPPLRILAFGVFASIAVPHIVRLFRRTDDEAVALTIEVCVRNVGVALLLIHFFFPDSPAQGHVLYTCLFYAGISGALTLFPLLRHRYGRSPVLLRKALPPPKPAPADG